MKKCKVTFCESTKLVYSGTDAFMYGIPTETICYDCAFKYNAVIGIIEQHNSKVGI
jgi:hypothetical protein